MQTGLSIAIVIRNEELNIEKCLNSLLDIQSSNFPFEILIINNNSSDKSEKIVNDWKNLHPNISLIWQQRNSNHLGLARQLALETASYSYIAFIDADCIAPAQWASQLYTKIIELSLIEPKLMAIGSGNIVPQSTPFYRSLKLMLSSWFGNFNTMQAKPREIQNYVDHLPTCNVIYDRSKALHIGGFSPYFSDVCEDLDFSIRAKKLGYILLYVPGLEVLHFHTQSFSSWANKMFRYGRGQIDISRLHPSHLIGIKGLPLFFSLIGFLVFIINPLLATLLFSIYLIFILILSHLLTQKLNEKKIVLKVFSLFLITHIFYLAGELWGVLIFFRNR